MRVKVRVSVFVRTTHVFKDVCMCVCVYVCMCVVIVYVYMGK